MDEVNQPLAGLIGRSVYIDANIFIYFLDGQEPYLSMVTPLLEKVLEGEIIGYTGDAVIAEVMVHPYRLGDINVIEKFKAFFNQEDFLSIVSHDARAFEASSRLSGTTPMKLIDSLHLATAMQSGCSHFVTNDKKIKSVEGIEVVQLADIGR